MARSSTSRLGRSPKAIMPTLVLLALAALGAGPPEVLRVRVPSAKVRAFFPPDTNLRGMSLEEFEALVRSAREGAERQTRLEEPRLLRARHWAGLADGALIGHSELIVEGPQGRDSSLRLDPWSPAIDPSRSPEDVLRVRDDGRASIHVSGGRPASITVAWTLKSRP